MAETEERIIHRKEGDKTTEPITDLDVLGRFKRAAGVVGSRNFMLIHLGVHLGLRISDLLKIQVKDINKSIVEQKTQKKRKLYIPSSILKDVNDYIQAEKLSETDYLFYSRKGKGPISRQQAYRIIKKAANDCGLGKKQIGTHTLRKTFGYHFYNQFGDIAQLQTIFNHSTQEMTKIYIGVSQEAIENNMDKLNLTAERK